MQQKTPTADIPAARFITSPNFDDRPDNETINLIVIHAISLPPNEFGGPGIEQLFTNMLDATAHPYYQEIHTLRVSAHFLIRRDGELIQFVPCEKRAWHAGLSTWQGRECCNNFSLGIELEGCDEQAFTDAQYATLKPLLSELRKHYPITDIVGHKDIAPQRKTDPGPHFDWLKIQQPD